MASTTKHPTAHSTPRAYLIKECQCVISFFMLNHMKTKGSMQRKAQLDMFHTLYHGTGSEDQLQLPFVRQFLHGMSVFKPMMVCDGTRQEMLEAKENTKSNRLHPLLVPGADGRVLVGDGPTVDIRLEHLEKASISGTTLITGRTLMRQGELALRALKKADAWATKFLGPDGEYPSGTGIEDFLDKLMTALLEERSTTTKDANGEDVVYDTEDESPNPLASLTQGVQARAAAKAAEISKKCWAYKMVPFPYWMVIVLFVKGGIARHSLENSLPLLKDCDYKGLSEKKKHSRSSARKMDSDAKSRARGSGRMDLSVGGYAMKDHLMASCVSMLANNKEIHAGNDQFRYKKEQLRAAQGNLKHLERSMNMRIAMGRNCDADLKQHALDLEKCRRLQKELEDLAEELGSVAKQSDEVVDRAIKVAQLVNGSLPSGCEKDDGGDKKIPSSKASTKASKSGGVVPFEIFFDDNDGSVATKSVGTSAPGATSASSSIMKRKLSEFQMALEQTEEDNDEE